jgi:ornithine cyclodeaminase
MELLVLSESEIRRLVSPADAFTACLQAFADLANGLVVQPDVLALDLPEHNGDVHAKGAYIRGTPYFTIKVAAGFYGNVQLGLPVLSGAVWVFDASTGFLKAILFDDGLLTNLRTGAAGAVAARFLARENIRQVAVLGCGSQGRYQLGALLQVRHPELVVAYSRTPQSALAYARETQAKHGVKTISVDTVPAALHNADLVITATPSREPIVRTEWIAPGTHITAVGSDLPEKQELEATLLGRAKLIADRFVQCATHGEVHHALRAGVIQGIYAELGEIVAGKKPGRTSDDEITIADLTGVGALDAAMGNCVMAKAAEHGVGRMLKI